MDTASKAAVSISGRMNIALSPPVHRIPTAPAKLKLQVFSDIIRPLGFRWQ
jgi:hypothetical protein